MCIRDRGKIDAVIIDREPAKVFVKENEGLKILDEAFTEEEYAIAVKKGNTELLDKMNAAIKELKESGELQKIVDKYITCLLYTYRCVSETGIKEDGIPTLYICKMVLLSKEKYFGLILIPISFLP